VFYEYYPGARYKRNRYVDLFGRTKAAGDPLHRVAWLLMQHGAKVCTTQTPVGTGAKIFDLLGGRKRRYRSTVSSVSGTLLYRQQRRLTPMRGGFVTPK